MLEHRPREHDAVDQGRCHREVGAVAQCPQRLGCPRAVHVERVADRVRGSWGSRRGSPSSSTQATWHDQRFVEDRVDGPRGRSRPRSGSRRTRVRRCGCLGRHGEYRLDLGSASVLVPVVVGATSVGARRARSRRGRRAGRPRGRSPRRARGPSSSSCRRCSTASPSDGKASGSSQNCGGILTSDGSFHDGSAVVASSYHRRRRGASVAPRGRGRRAAAGRARAPAPRCPPRGTCPRRTRWRRRT